MLMHTISALLSNTLCAFLLCHLSFISHNVRSKTLLSHYCPIPTDTLADVEKHLDGLDQEELKALCGRLVNAHVSHDKVCWHYTQASKSI